MSVIQTVGGMRDDFTLEYSTHWFFDKGPVMQLVAEAERQVLSKFGAFVRQRARTSIRPGGKKGKISEPGEPPRSHSPEPNIRTIFFAYEPDRHTVVIGPVALNHLPTTSLVRGVIPAALEHGGELDLIETKIGDRWFTGRPRRRRGDHDKQTRVRRVHIRPRPFMFPALEEEAPKFLDLWAGSVGRAAA